MKDDIDHGAYYNGPSGKSDSVYYRVSQMPVHALLNLKGAGELGLKELSVKLGDDVLELVRWASYTLEAYNDGDL